MFIPNKYTSYYYNIVNYAKSQDRKKLKSLHVNFIYFELHHIIPKCLGGTNEKDNLVLLTAREHFLCHWLLTKMFSNFRKIKQMQRALSRFHSINKNMCRNLTSKQYAIARSMYKISQTGYTHTQESKEKISKAVKERWKNTDYRNDMIQQTKERHANFEFQQKFSESMRKSHQNSNRKKRVKLPKELKKKTYVSIMHPIKNIYKEVLNNQVPAYQKCGYIKIGSPIWI